MLHSLVYNTGISRDLKDAYVRRDHDFFHYRIILLASNLIARPLEGEDFEKLLRDMHIALALHDSLVNNGQTVSLMTDFVNL